MKGEYFAHLFDINVYVFISRANMLYETQSYCTCPRYKVKVKFTLARAMEAHREAQA
jgi:predicted nucleic acid-binding Zn finger protein